MTDALTATIDRQAKQLDEPFDFLRHEQTAISEYLAVRTFWVDAAQVFGRILGEAIKKREIQVHSVDSRAKDPSSFGKKASKPSEIDPLKPKYLNPLAEITDLAASRIITFFPRTVDEIGSLLEEEFQIVEKSDKSQDLREEERFGYQSVHYLIRLTDSRTSLPEYSRFKDAVIEVQVRTILQHSWAEIEHDIQYKSSAAIPGDIKRRFMALAGLLELADREFQAIQDADRALNAAARTRVEEGQLRSVEITPDALKAYLDKREGPDGRVSDWSYEWAATMLKNLGFNNLDEVDACIRGQSGDQLSRIMAGNRQGQITRFEFMLLAGMREDYIVRHPWAHHDWFVESSTKRLRSLDRFNATGQVAINAPWLTMGSPSSQTSPP